MQEKAKFHAFLQWGIQRALTVWIRTRRQQVSILWVQPDLEQQSTDQQINSNNQNAKPAAFTHLFHEPFKKFTFSNTFTCLCQWYTNYPTCRKIKKSMTRKARSLYAIWNVQLQLEGKKTNIHDTLIDVTSLQGNLLKYEVSLSVLYLILFEDIRS